MTSCGKDDPKWFNDISLISNEEKVLSIVVLQRVAEQLYQWVHPLQNDFV